MTVIACEWCRLPFVREHHRGPTPRFCSAACRQRAFRARHPEYEPVVCPHCGARLRALFEVSS